MRLAIAVIAAAYLACSPGQADSYDGNGRVILAATGNFGQETLALINSYRASRGLSPLKSNGTLQALALQHSRYQAARNRLGHDGYRQRAARAKAAGLTLLCAENVGRNYRTPQRLLAGWVNSSAHRKNLLRPNLRYAGVSVVGAYATFFACQ